MPVYLDKKDCDFSGWVTRNDIRCTDGRTIKQNAFAHCDGQVVPMVWNHSHDNPLNVLGQILLENRPHGVYGYGYFNDTEFGEAARRQVMHGDITSLSICANHVKQRGGDVLHGDIKEVSLVLSGANKGARIDYVLQHSDGSDNDDSEAIIYCDYIDEFIVHSDDVNVSEDDNMNENIYHSDVDVESLARSLTDEQRAIVLQILSENLGLSLQHADDGYGEIRAIINRLSRDERNALLYVLTKDMDLEHYDDTYEIQHNEMSPEEVLGTLMTLNDDQMNAVYAILGTMAIGEDDIQHADDALGEIYGTPVISTNALLSTLSPKQKDCVMAFLSYAEDNKYELQHNEDVINAYYGYDDDDDYTIAQGDDNMSWNAFENNYGEGGNVEFTQADLAPIFEDGKRFGSLKESVIAHADEYGIDNIDFLFPDARNLDNKPGFVQRNMEWVGKVLNAASHTPFTRVKSMWANITEDEARARGYIKGKKKKEEVFKLLKRTTTPQTVYKKQKLDKDDIVDITDFDVVAWIKTEMRMMLDEELARAILIGDGRSTSDEDHISEDHVRPIAKDDSFFTIKVTVKTDTDRAKVAKAFMQQAVRARKDYRGAGSPTLFTTEDLLTEMLLLEDGIGHRLYKSEAELATALRLSSIVPVQILENQKDANNKPILGIIVNMKDYQVGTDKGGSIHMFEDFDIDYNQEKYLIETRISGALTVPYSAIVLTESDSNSTTGWGGSTIPTGDMDTTTL